MMPLYEAKMLHLYDTRWATYDTDGTSRVMTDAERWDRTPAQPRYWVAEAEIDRKLADEGSNRAMLGWRRICRATDARTLITTKGPRVGYGDSWFLASAERGHSFLQALWSSYALDYVARQKLGGTNMNFFTFAQLPVPAEILSEPFRADRSLRAWVDLRVDRLNGWIADTLVRARVRAELDAAAFHVYGVTRNDAAYMLETFPIVKRKELDEFGTFRTKELIMAAYDAMAEAKVSGTPYRAPWEDA